MNIYTVFCKHAKMLMIKLKVKCKFKKIKFEAEGCLYK